MTNYQEEFRQSLENIEQLVELPALIQQSVLEILAKVDHAKLSYLENQATQNAYDLIAGIESGSLKSSYKIIYNQVCILAVSTLSAYLEKYFQEFATYNLDKLNSLALDKIKVTLLEAFNLSSNISNIGSLITDKDGGINFQDLQSILKSFNEYLGKNIVPDDATRNKIIFYQHCRHLLVHNNGIINQYFLDKVGQSNLKSYKIDDLIQLDQDDWINIKQSFTELYRLITR